MSRAEKKNVVASVLARLRSTSRLSCAPFQQVLQQYAMERFLYRISKSEHASDLEPFEALTNDFAESHRAQWNAFVKKIGEDTLTHTFDKVVADLQFFVMPLLRTLARRDNLTQQWIPGTGWATA
jgi:hypothetical protein